MRSMTVCACVQKSPSGSFSMPVWRYPISGSAFTTFSLSISSTICRTPCVDGCCGPIDSTIVVSDRLITSGGGVADRVMTLPRGPVSLVPATLQAYAPKAGCLQRRWSCSQMQAAARARVGPAHRVIFSQRMTNPVVRHLDAAKIRVSVEANSKRSYTSRSARSADFRRSLTVGSDFSSSTPQRIRTRPEYRPLRPSTALERAEVNGRRRQTAARDPEIIDGTEVEQHRIAVGFERFETRAQTRWRRFAR